MRKRRRCPTNTHEQHGRPSAFDLRMTEEDITKRPYILPNTGSLRRSLRLEKKTNASQAHLPSPATSTEQEQKGWKKRKSVIEDSPSAGAPRPEKKRKTSDSTIADIYDQGYKDWITYWVFEDATLPPPKFFANTASMTSNPSGQKRVRTESTRMSDRRARLEENHVFIFDTWKMNADRQTFCEKLLDGNRKPEGYPFYREEHRSAVLRRAATASEAIIQRDILPTLIPSVENLKLLNLEFFKDIDLDPFIDEINAEWKRTNTMAGKHPKPDYVAGLRRGVFDSATWNSLARYATPDTPVLLSPDMCFPLLLGEAKRGQDGIQLALMQAIHAGAIAVKSQISLHWAAYGKTHAKVTELYGQPLVFSVCHNHEEVYLLVHYALFELGKLQFYHAKLKQVNLTMYGGRNQDQPNNFVENVYKTCGPLHLARIKEAAKKLREEDEKKRKEEKEKEKEKQKQKQRGEQREEARSQPSTGVSFGTAQLGLEDDASDGTASEGSQDSGTGLFKKPKLPESAQTAKELALIRRLMEEQKTDFEQRTKEQKVEKEKLERQLEEQRLQIRQFMDLLGSSNPGKR